jgi:hypothetical protein
MTTPPFLSAGPSLSFHEMLQRIDSGALHDYKNTYRDETNTHSNAYGIASMLATFEKLYSQIVLVDTSDTEKQSWQLAWVVSALTINHEMHFEVKLMCTSDYKKVPVHRVMHQVNAQQIAKHEHMVGPKARMAKNMKSGPGAYNKRAKTAARRSAPLYHVTFASIVVRAENGVRAKTQVRCLPKGYVQKSLW